MTQGPMTFATDTDVLVGLGQAEPIARKDLQTLYVPKPLHRKLAIIAATKGVSLRSLSQHVLQNFADRHEVEVTERDATLN